MSETDIAELMGSACMPANTRAAFDAFLFASAHVRQHDIEATTGVQRGLARTEADGGSRARRLVRTRVQALQPRGLKCLALPLVQRPSACGRRHSESTAPLCSAGHAACSHLPVPQAHGWQAAAPYRCTSCRIFSKSLSSSTAAVRAPVAARNAGPVAAACTCSARPDKKRRRSLPTPARWTRSPASVLLHAPAPGSFYSCHTGCKDRCETEPRRDRHSPTSGRGAFARPGLVEDHHCARGVRHARVAVVSWVLVGGRRLWCAGQRRGLGRRRTRSSPLHRAGILPEQPQKSLACSTACSELEHPGRALQLSRQQRTVSGKALGCLLLHLCSRGRSRCPRPLPLQCSHSPPGLQSSISSSHSRARSSLDSLTMSRHKCTALGKAECA